MPVTYDLRGKVALVTGAAGGIGRATHRLLVESGAAVHAWDSSDASDLGPHFTKIDVTDHAAVRTAAERFISNAGRLDIVGHCAGYLGSAQPFATHDPADWSRIVQVNLVGTMNVIQALAPFMVARGAGVIVTFGSLAGKEGLVGLAAYSAASAGVIGFTKAVGRELAGSGVRVNCIAPGPIDTRMISQLGAQTVAAMIADSPMKRLGEADEVAHLVAWLCSDASRFNTGAVFDMSGGRARY